MRFQPIKALYVKNDNFVSQVLCLCPRSVFVDIFAMSKLDGHWTLEDVKSEIAAMETLLLARPSDLLFNAVAFSRTCWTKSIL